MDQTADAGDHQNHDRADLIEVQSKGNVKLADRNPIKEMRLNNTLFGMQRNELRYQNHRTYKRKLPMPKSRPIPTESRCGT